MKKIIRLIVVCLAVFICTPATSAAQKGEKTFGVRTGYVSRNNSADIGLFFQYTFSEHFRLQPAADIIVRHNDRDAFIVDLNAQVPIDISGENFSLYPLAGLNFSSWNHHYSAIPTPEEEMLEEFSPEWSSRTNRFGVNLGAGFDLKVSSTLKLSLEASYTFVKSNSGLRILAGIGYVF